MSSQCQTEQSSAHRKALITPLAITAPGLAPAAAAPWPNLANLAESCSGKWHQISAGISTATLNIHTHNKHVLFCYHFPGTVNPSNYATSCVGKTTRWKLAHHQPCVAVSLLRPSGNTEINSNLWRHNKFHGLALRIKWFHKTSWNLASARSLFCQTALLLITLCYITMLLQDNNPQILLSTMTTQLLPHPENRTFVILIKWEWKGMFIYFIDQEHIRSRHIRARRSLKL